MAIKARKELTYRRSLCTLIILTFSIVVFCIQMTGCASIGQLSEERLDRYLAGGTVLMDAGDYRGALDYYRSLALRFPKEQKIRYNLAIAQVTAGDFSDALGSLDLLDTLAGGRNVTYVRAIGGVAAASDNPFIAEDAWRRVISLDPLDLESRNRLVLLLEKDGRFEEAFETALGAFALRQYSSELFTTLARMERAAGRGDGTSWTLLAQIHRK